MNREFVRNRPEILMFFGRQISAATQISDRILYTWITVERVAKFGDDRPSDLGD